MMIKTLKILANPFIINSNFIAPIRNIKCLYSYNYFSFSKTKKQKPEVVHLASIKMSKLNTELNGFLIYQNEQGLRIKTITAAFILCFLSGLWTYQKITDDQIKVNYMIMGAILVVPFIVFQFRTSKTLKYLLLDKSGQEVILSRFKMGGFQQQVTKTKIEVLRGIGKGFIFGGTVIKGGGAYGLEERNYWFQSKYIKERECFQQLVQGNRVRIDKI